MTKNIKSRTPINSRSRKLSWLGGAIALSVAIVFFALQQVQSEQKQVRQQQYAESIASLQGVQEDLNNLGELRLLHYMALSPALNYAIDARIAGIDDSLLQQLDPATDIDSSLAERRERTERRLAELREAAENKEEFRRVQAERTQARLEELTGALAEFKGQHLDLASRLEGAEESYQVKLGEMNRTVMQALTLLEQENEKNQTTQTLWLWIIPLLVSLVALTPSWIDLIDRKRDKA